MQSTILFNIITILNVFLTYTIVYSQRITQNIMMLIQLTFGLDYHCYEATSL